MEDIAVVILTMNEEKNIVQAMENAGRCAKEIIVIDSGSRDRTVRLAEEQGAKVILRPLGGDFSAQRNFALAQTTAKWVLYLDADERMNDELIESIRAKDNRPAQYEIRRQTVAFGQRCRGVLKSSPVSRLFLRESVRWVNRIHEEPLCDLKKERLDGYIEHYTYDNWDRYLEKLNSYTTLAAERYADRGKKCHFFTDIVIKPFLAFWKVYLLRGGFRDGRLGWIASINHAFYVMTKYVKLYYLKRS
ncbi:MAG: glycosyltransferase family 2 protein [Helicobacteraceae bacterium]|jgi:glycosyltransferase involved in cell wall biosynthesis|nr:glycosyltransferase family 2 protein [Helicobacteraceae bacterium]